MLASLLCEACMRKIYSTLFSKTKDYIIKIPEFAGIALRAGSASVLACWVSSGLYLKYPGVNQTQMRGFSFCYKIIHLCGWFNNNNKIRGCLNIAVSLHS